MVETSGSYLLCSLGFSYWQVGEPNRYKEDEDCVEKGNNNWADVPCDVLNLWICEKKASPTALINAGMWTWFVMFVDFSLFVKNSFTVQLIS